MDEPETSDDVMAYNLEETWFRHGEKEEDGFGYTGKR
jgi:hypothetical protein